MFYAQFILAKKGPLGTIWIAAHLERKLRKNQVAETDIGVSVDSILSPDDPIALRMSSHLLLGVVRIYNRKVNYLFDDCSEALLKVKQAFRSTAVDLPPEQSKAPYHSITMPETFDLDDFELPEHLGNYVDHHVSSREQITLQDKMEGVTYSTSLFGLDERFGDGDTSGVVDIDEELLMRKVDSFVQAGSSSNPHEMEGSKEDDMHRNIEPMNDGADEDDDFMYDAQAPRTPRLIEEPNFSSACYDQIESFNRQLNEFPTKVNFGDSYNKNIDDWSLPNHTNSPSHRDILQFEPHEKITYVTEQILPVTEADKVLEAAFNHGKTSIYLEDRNKSSPEKRSDDISGYNHVSGNNYTSISNNLENVEILEKLPSIENSNNLENVEIQEKAQSHSNTLDVDLNLEGQTCQEPQVSKFLSFDVNEKVYGSEFPVLRPCNAYVDQPDLSIEPNLCNENVNEDPIPGLEKTCGPDEIFHADLSNDEVDNRIIRDSSAGADLSVSAPEKLVLVTEVPEIMESNPENLVSNERITQRECVSDEAIGKSNEELDNMIMGDSSVGADLSVTEIHDNLPKDLIIESSPVNNERITEKENTIECESDEVIQANIGKSNEQVDNNIMSVNSSAGADLSVPEKLLSVTEVHDNLHKDLIIESSPKRNERVTEKENTEECESDEVIQVTINKSNEQVDNTITRDNWMENVNNSAPEKLMSVTTQVPEIFSRNLIMESTPKNLVRNNEVDFGSSVFSGKKRSYTESTLTEQSLNSFESSRIVRSKRTIESIPDDNDLLSSILVGRKSSILEVKASPSPWEMGSVKKRYTPKSSANKSANKSGNKRKVLMDDNMVIPGDTIRRQLMDTEDIRRVRKKAPCTQIEIVRIQQQLLEDAIFMEPVYTGESVELRSLHNEEYDFSGIKIIVDDENCGNLNTENAIESSVLNINKEIEKENEKGEVEEIVEGGKKMDEDPSLSSEVNVGPTIDVEPNISFTEPPPEDVTETDSIVNEVVITDQRDESALPSGQVSDDTLADVIVQTGHNLETCKENVPDDTLADVMVQAGHNLETCKENVPDDTLADVMVQTGHNLETCKENVSDDTLADVSQVAQIDDIVEKTDKIETCQENVHLNTDETYISHNESVIEGSLEKVSADVSQVTHIDDVFQKADNIETCQENIHLHNTEASFIPHDEKVNEVSSEKVPDDMVQKADNIEETYQENVSLHIDASNISHDENERVIEASQGIDEGETRSEYEVFMKEVEESAPDIENQEIKYDSHGKGIDESMMDYLFNGVEEVEMHMENDVFMDHEDIIINPLNTTEDPETSFVHDHDGVDYSNVEYETGFLNDDDDDDDYDDVAEPTDDNITNHEVRFTENSGWSSRTRAVANYLQTLYVKQTANGRGTLSMDNLLVGKTRKEASRMFFEALVLKTRDYIHVEQENPFENIAIKANTKLLKSDF